MHEPNETIFSINIKTSSVEKERTEIPSLHVCAHVLSLTPSQLYET